MNNKTQRCLARKVAAVLTLVLGAASAPVPAQDTPATPTPQVEQTADQRLAAFFEELVDDYTTNKDAGPGLDKIQVKTGMMAVEGGQLYYEVAGAGQPVLLIHGNTGDRRHWDLQFKALARDYRVIRFDLRGFGSSSVPSAGVAYTNHGDAAALLDGLGVGRAHVAGWSLGSAIAIDFAMAFPDRTLSLMVVGPWIMGYNSPGAQEMFQGMGQVATAMTEVGPAAAVDALMNASFMTATIRDPAAAVRFRAIAEDYSFWGFINPSSQLLMDPPALGRTGDIRVPTLIVSGEFDVPACMEIGVLLDETIPDSRLVVMPATGHMMLMEKAGEFNQIVLEFLAQEAGEDVNAPPREETMDLASRTPSGMTLLHTAVDEGDVEKTRQLLHKGIQLNLGNVYGWTALHIASEKGLTEIMELLLDAGTSVDAKTNGGETAFHLATEAGHNEAARLLVSNGAATTPSRFPKMRGEYFGQPKPGPRAEPFALAMLATRHDHYNRAVTFSPDGREAYWPVLDLQDNYRRWIVGSRIEAGVWTRPSIAAFSRKGNGDDVPSLSPSGNKLLFLSWRPLVDGGVPDKENIWFVTRDREDWSEPMPLPGAVNSLGTLHQQVSLDREDNLYFSAEAAGGHGSLDLYFSRFVNGEYAEPVNLGPVINGPDAEYTPSVSPGGDYLVFTRNVDDGWSLFISFQTGDGYWTPPADLSASIEGVDGMNLSGPHITHDGRFMIFFGERDVAGIPFWIDTAFIEDLRAVTLEKM